MADIEFGVRITADNKVFIEGVEASEKQLRELGRGLNQVAKDGGQTAQSMDGLTGSVVKGTIATDLLTKTVDFAADTYQKMRSAVRDAQQDQARVDAVIMATGRTAEVSTGRINAFAEAMARATKFDDGEIRRANATLLTFANLSQAQIERVIKAAADLSSVYGGDLQSNALMVAKAMTETGNTIGPLERKFGDLDVATKNHINTLKEMGETNAAADAVLAQVEKRVGGTAVESYRGLERQIEGTKKAYEDLLKVVGNEIFDARSRDAGVLERAFRSMADTFTSRVGAMRDAFNSLGEFKDVLLVLWGIRTPGQVAAAQLATGPTKPPAGAGGASAAGGESAEARATRIEQEAANARYDELLEKLDRRRAMEREIATFVAIGNKAGREEAEIALGIAAIREKYLHEQANATREAKRRAREEAASAAEEKKRERAIDQAALADAKEMVSEQEKRDAIVRSIVAQSEEARERSELELKLIGATRIEAEHLRREFELRRKLEAEIAVLDKDQQEAMRAELETTLLILRTNANIAEVKKQILEVTRQATKDEAQAMLDVSAFAAEAITNLVMNGRRGLEMIRGQLKQLLADMIKIATQRWLIQLVGSVTGNGGAAGAAAAVGANTAAGIGSNLISTAASSALSATGVGAYASSAWGAASAGYTAQAAYLSGASEIAASSGTVWGAIGSGVAEIAAAIPVWGWILLAILALVAIFSKPGGGPKVEGAFIGEYGPNGAQTGTSPQNLFRTNELNGTMEKVVTGMASSYFDALARLGGTSTGATFGLGASMDPRGDAPTIVEARATVGGRTAYNYSNGEVGRDGDGLQKELADQIPRIILGALQASNWDGFSKGVGDILQSVNPYEASAEAIKGVIELADTFSQVINAMREIDLDKFLTDISKGPQTRFQEMGRALLDLSGKTKITQESLQRMGQATNEYKNAVAQLLMGFEAAKQEINGMFGDTIRSIKLGNMDNSGKYGFYQKEADDLLSKIEGSTNAEEIRNWAAKINEDINAAYALLSPDEQRRQEAEYLARIERTNKIVADRLEKVQKDTATEANAILKEIKEAMDLKAAQFKEAAEINLEAAHLNQVHQVHVDIDLRDNRLAATVVNGG